jgi:hypothetical protein
MSYKVGLLIVLLLLTILPAAAQEDDGAPIIVLNGGDLWMWDGPGKPMERMTFWGYNQQPVLSPSGSWAAYMAWSPITVDALKREGGVAGGEVPGDIRVLNITTGQETTIAAQPPDASFFIEGIPDKAVIRSKPTWSPDGSMLAWTEYDYPGDGTNRAVTYHFGNDELQTWVAALPSQAGVPVPIDVAWGESGLILRSYTPRPDAPSIFETTFLVYDGSSPDTLLNTVLIPETAERFVVQYVLVTYEDQEYIGVGYSNEDWDLFHPMTGDSMPAPGALEMYSPSAPNNSMSLLLVPEEFENGISSKYKLLDPAGVPIGVVIDLGLDPAGHIALSPDGQGIAYLPYDDQASVYDDTLTFLDAEGQIKQTIDIPPYGMSFMWGPVAWRIRS